MANEVEVLITSKDRSAPGFKAAREETEKFRKGADEAGGGLDKFGQKADDVDTKAMGFRDTLTGVQDTMKGTGQIAKGQLFQGFLTLGMGIGDLGSGIYNFGVPAFKALKNGFITSAKEAVIGAATHVRQAARVVVSWVVMATQATINAARMAIAWVVAMGPVAWAIGILVLLGIGFVVLWKKCETFRNIVKAALRVVGDAATWLWEKAIQPAFHAISGAIGNVLRWFHDLPGNIQRVFHNAVGWLAAAGRNVVNGLWNGLKDVWNSAIAWLRRIPRGIVNIFGGGGGWLYQKGKDVLSGLWDGLKAMWSTVVGWFKGLPRKFLEALGIKSPPQWAVDAGRHIMDGIVKGFGGKDVMIGRVKSMAKEWGRAFAPGGRSLGGYTGSGPQVGNMGPIQGLVQGWAAADYGWTGRQWTALYNLIMGESGFNPNAQNPTSSAYGIFQFLDSTWGSVGARKTSDPYGQTIAGLRYIAQRYGNPVNAYSTWLSRSPHWYGSGGLITEPIMGIGRSGQVYGFGENGVETVTPGDGRGGRAGRLVLEIRSGGTRLDDALVELIRNAVRVRGGNVQTALGR